MPPNQARSRPRPLRYWATSGKRTWEIKTAYEDLMSRGKGWMTRFERGRKATEKTYPEMDVSKWLRE